MAEPLLQADLLVKAFGALRASDNLSLDVAAGEIHALIGPNGAGKTTAIAQLSGELKPDEGRVRFQGADITGLAVHARARLGLARSYQITSIFPAFAAEANVALAIQAGAPHSFQFWKPAAGDPDLVEPARRVLALVGLGERAGVAAAALSHGEQRQLELAMALATEPVMLLLDEPMAGLGAEETGRMVGTLRALRGRVTILLVEHDMDAVFQLADRITVLVKGRAIATGAPGAIRADAQVRAAYLGEVA